VDELDKARKIEVDSTLRQEVLAAARAKLDEWGLVMPPNKPLILDFGLGDFYRVGMIEYWIANEVEAGYCGKLFFLFDGQTCPTHHHRTKVETFHLMKGKLRVTYDGVEREMSPGDVLLVETPKSHSFTAVGPSLVLEISMPAIVDDNYFEDPAIPIGGSSQ
jgi:quercetin dioxygenase-like cupin family protein